MLHVLNFIYKAWQKVRVKTIENAFYLGGFVRKYDYEPDDKTPFNQWFEKHPD